MAYLAQESTTFANAWGYEEQKRDLEFQPMLDEAHMILAQGIDALRFGRAPHGIKRDTPQDRLASELHKLATLLHSDRRAQADTKERIGAAITAVRPAITVA
jgi:hypothetical protein